MARRGYEREHSSRRYDEDEGRRGRAGERGYDEDRGRYDDDRGRSGREGRYGGGYGREEYGREGSGREGSGREGPGREGYGREGSGREGGGGSGREGYGREDYGREGYAGGYGAGREGPYEGGYGREGYGREATAGRGYGMGGERYGDPDRERRSGQSASWSYTEIWMIPGPQTGRGPRNFRRSDERIREEVCERLTRHGQIDASDVDIDVRDGEVTLRGTVDSRQTRRTAEEAIEDVAGVRDVHNELRAGGRRAGGGLVGEARGEAPSATAGRSGGRLQLREGMEVVGSDGDDVGRVKEVRDDDFLVDRSMRRDIYVPFSAIMNVGEDRVTLNVTADRVDDMDWESPGVTETDTESRHREGDTGIGHRYGSAMASDPRYRGRSWEDVEPDLRSGYGEWARREGGREAGEDAWDRLREDVRRTWDESRR